MVGLTELLASARAAGLTWHADGERLIVRGPRSAGDIATQLLAHKSELLTTHTPQPPLTATEFIYDRIPNSVIDDMVEHTMNIDGKTDWKTFPNSPLPECHCCRERRWWRSIFGQHLICGVCHPPSRNNVVAEWIPVRTTQE